TALASAQAATGEFAEARTAFLESLALLPEEDASRRVRLTVACAGVEQLLGRYEEARARLTAAFDALNDQASPEAAALAISLALDSLYRPAHDDWRRWSQRAIEVAVPLGDPTLTAAAFAVAAVLSSYSSEIAEGNRYCEEAAALIDAMSDPELADCLEAVTHLSGAEAYLERFEESIAHAHRALAVARATGERVLPPTLVPALWTSLWMRGRLTEGVELLHGAVAGAELGGTGPALAFHLLNRGFAAALAGDLELALAVSGEAWDLARELEEGIASMWAEFGLAAVHMESGNPTRAVELFVSSGGGEDLPLIPGVWRILTLEWL